MLNVIGSAERFCGRKSISALLLALAVALLVPFFSQSSVVMAQEETPPAADAAAAPAAADAAPADAAAAPAAATDSAAPPQSRSFLAYIARACGWFWGPVFLLASFILVALIMMNLLQVRRDVLLPTAFVEEFEQKLNAKDFQAAYEFARSDESFVARVLAAGMGRLSRGYDEAVEGMQEVGEEETMKLDHRLSYIALIGNVSPMVGLLGTVQGMIASFEVIASNNSTPKPAELAAGISTALFTTLVGLIIAIPAIAIFNILRNRQQRLVLEVGVASERIIGRFENKK